MKMTNNDYFCINEDKVKAEHVLYQDAEGYFILEIWNCSHLQPDYVFRQKEFYPGLMAKDAEGGLISFLYACGDRLSSPVDMNHLLALIEEIKSKN